MTEPVNNKIYFIFAAFLLGTGILSCFVGRMDIPFENVMSTMVRFPLLLVDIFSGDYTRLTEQERVLMLIRFPRILLALLVGTGLSVSGAVYQGLFRNPLVSPDILGVAAGCTFGASVGLLIPGSSFFLVRILSFAMGLCAVGIALAMARAVQTSRVLVLVLTGVITGSLFHSLFMIAKTVADPFGELPAIVFWVMGSLSGTSWLDTLQIMPIILIGYAIFHLFRYKLNVLSLGDETAKALGVNPKGLRFFLIAISSLMVAVCVASCGQIAWVGLVIPHIVRTISGPNHRFLIPGSALLGASFLLLADDIARSALSSELPLGVITSLIGAPVFAWLLYKSKNKGWA
jgi:iron complex transport system permease protein